jgi:hypothetical protein
MALIKVRGHHRHLHKVNKWSRIAKPGTKAMQSSLASGALCGGLVAGVVNVVDVAANDKPVDEAVVDTISGAVTGAGIAAAFAVNPVLGVGALLLNAVVSS